MTNVFKIKHNKETHVYRTESPADKKGLLAQFRQVAEELSQKKRKEREGEHERRKSMWQGSGGTVTGIGGVRVILAARNLSHSRLTVFSAILLLHLYLTGWLS